MGDGLTPAVAGRRGRALRLAGALLAAAGFAAAGPAQAQNAPKVAPTIARDLRVQGVASVIIMLKDPGVGARDMQAAVAFGDPVGYLKKSLPRGVNGLARVEGQRSGAVVARIVDRAALERLASDPNVALVAHNVADPPALVDTVRRAGALRLWDLGHDGGGPASGGRTDRYAIAVLDTGVEAGHPFLASKLVDQACFSFSDPAQGVESLCPGGETLSTNEVVDLSPGSAAGCPRDTSGCDHGTHVAGIAAGFEMNDPADARRRIAGLAKGAGIVAIQIFSRFTRAQACAPEPAPCVRAFRSSQLRALEHIETLVRRRQATGSGPEIVAINMSLGGGQEVAHCDNATPLTRPIRQLRELGVATFIASGNESFRTGVGQPGCISFAITVGAIDKQGAIADFTNRDQTGTLVDLMTIGVNVRSAVFGGGFDLKSGTSMATPAAAGAYALLKSAHPSLGIDALEQALKTRGGRVRDPASGFEFPVIDLARAHEGLDQGAVAGVALRPIVKPMGAALETDETARYFIVAVPAGRVEAGRAAAAVPDAAGRLGAGRLAVEPLGTDTLSVVTEQPVSRSELEKMLRESVDIDVTVTVNRADRPLPQR